VRIALPSIPHLLSFPSARLNFSRVLFQGRYRALVTFYFAESRHCLCLTLLHYAEAISDSTEINLDRNMGRWLESIGALTPVDGILTNLKVASEWYNITWQSNMKIGKALYRSPYGPYFPSVAALLSLCGSSNIVWVDPRLLRLDLFLASEWRPHFPFAGCPKQNSGARVPQQNSGVPARVPGPTTKLRGPGPGPGSHNKTQFFALGFDRFP